MEDILIEKALLKKGFLLVEYVLNGMNLPGKSPCEKGILTCEIRLETSDPLREQSRKAPFCHFQEEGALYVTS